MGWLLIIFLLVLFVAFIGMILFRGQKALDRSDLGYVKKEARKLIESGEIKDTKRYYKIANYLAKAEKDVEAEDILKEMKQLKENN